MTMLLVSVYMFMVLCLPSMVQAPMILLIFGCSLVFLEPTVPRYISFVGYDGDKVNVHLVLMVLLFSRRVAFGTGDERRRMKKLVLVTAGRAVLASERDDIQALTRGL